MQVPVLVEPVANNGYRARSGEPLPLSAEGATIAEALKRLQELLAQRMEQGAQFLTVELPGNNHPWAAMAGIYEKDPLFEEWQEIIAERRRLDEATSELP